MKRTLIRAAVFLALTAGVGVAGAGNALACGPVESRSVVFASSLPQVRYGNHGVHVLALQLALRREGYTNLQGTGNYAANTLHAVRDFQRKHGIKDSGIVGSKTWHALIDGKTLPGSGPVVYLRPGQQSRDVFQVVNALQRIYPYNDQYDERDPQDTYGPVLQRKVKDFQRRAGIKASGIVGPLTSKALDEVASADFGFSC